MVGQVSVTDIPLATGSALSTFRDTHSKQQLEQTSLSFFHRQSSVLQVLCQRHILPDILTFKSVP